MHDCQSGERLQVNVAHVRHGRICEEDDAVKLARGDERAELLITAPGSALKALDGKSGHIATSGFGENLETARFQPSSVAAEPSPPEGSGTTSNLPLIGLSSGSA